jgi:nitrite reductase/ring-hydroxylating ferredoxin subunit
MKKHLIFESEAEANKIIPLNSIRKIQIDNKQYCLGHTQGGFIVFQLACSHAGGDLSKGALNAFNQIVCPLHTYMFDLKTGKEERNRCPYIEVYEITWEQGKLFVELNGK